VGIYLLGTGKSGILRQLPTICIIPVAESACRTNQISSHQQKLAFPVYNCRHWNSGSLNAGFLLFRSPQTYTDRPRLNQEVREKMPEQKKELTHLDADGNARMVDVSAKQHTARQATARATVSMLPATLSLIEAGEHKKGDVLTVAKIAGIQAAKRCSDLIPMCHPLSLSGVDVTFELDPENNQVAISSMCRLSGQTGVEMEALTAAAVAALTIYDMCKGVDRNMSIGNVELLTKSGGKSGSWQREQP
tara:strand:- start:4 stop:747 length:744 start_codon:yes stop_codon:yes gene_type:complete